MNRNLVFILILIILSAGTFLPLLRGGFFEFHDNTQVERVHEMGKMLSQGTFPVRWVPDLGYGYGYPIFNFYSPLPYYIGGIISVLGFSALMSTKLMFLVGIILAPLIMYFSLKKIFNEEASFAGSLVYTYVPYHAVNIYVRGAVAEFFAFAFLPLIILGILRLIGSKNIKSQVWSGFSISAGVFLVAVSHNLTLLMTAVILLPLFILGLFLTGRKVVFAKVFAVSIIAGVLLSSFYTVPAFFEMNQTNVASQIGGGADFRDHFVCIGQFWNSAWGFGGSVPGCLDGLSFKLGKLHIILTVLSVAFLVLRLKNKKWNIYSKAALLSLVGLFLSIFMTLEVSKPLWESISVLSYLQYPWRFINFIALFVAILIAFFVHCIREKLGKYLYYVSFLLLVLGTLFVNAKLFSPQTFVTHNSSFYTELSHIRYTVSKISDEYLPSGFMSPQNINDLPKEDVQILKTTGTVEFEAVKYDRYKIYYNLKEDGVIHINRAYYPSWKAKLNDENMPIVATTNGMNISVKKGKGEMEIYMKSTPLQILGNAITLLSFFGILAAIMVFSRVKKYE